MTTRTMKTEKKYPEIGMRLRAIRESTGLNIKEFTVLCGVNYTRYINWESGERRISPDEAIDFCERFSVTMDFIYRGSLAMLPENILKALSSKPLEKAQSTSTGIPD